MQCEVLDSPASRSTRCYTATGVVAAVPAACLTNGLKCASRKFEACLAAGSTLRNVGISGDFTRNGGVAVQARRIGMAGS